MIKTIDTETIEFAYDFYFKLDEAQVEELITEYEKSQSMVSILFIGIDNRLKTKYQFFVLYRFALMVDYCFRNFYGTIPFISKQQIREKLAAIMKDIEENPEPSGNTNYPKLIEEASQEDLLKFIEARFEEFILVPDKINESQACDIFNIIITMTWLYHQEAEKLNQKGD